MKLKMLLSAVVAFVGLVAAYGTEVNLAAAASLKECMNEIIQQYQQANPAIKIVPNYEASGKLQVQIENGAPADLFISANRDKMNLLEKKGLLQPGTRCDLLENKVVLIVPAGGKLQLAGFQDLASDKLGEKSIAIGDPKVVPAGKYAAEIFKNLKIADAVMPKTVFAQNVRAVLTFVARGEVEAGVVYETDAKLMADKVRVAAQAPAGSHSPVIYPAAVIAAGAAKAEGEKFLAYLKTPAAAAVFQKYGFQPVK